MPNSFASGKFAIAECDRCGFRFRLQQLKNLTIKTKQTNILVCPTCWEPDQPQLQLGMYQIDDPQALRNPRPDNSYFASGKSGLQINTTVPEMDVDAYGQQSGGSRIVQWGWNPVGLNNPLQIKGLVDNLTASAQIQNVLVVTT